MPAVKILEALNDTPRLTPLLIASKTGLTVQRVRNLLAVLLELKLVETPSRGLYLITELGELVLSKLLKGDCNA